MTDFYDPDGNPITVEEWSALFEQRTQTTGKETWWQRKTVVGDAEISTVWLGLDHSFLTGPPLYWETMIFGDPRYEDNQWRYSTRAAAFDDHERIIRALRAGQDP